MEPKRRIVMFNWITANGCFAGADGNLDWVVPDEQQAKAAVDGIALFDTVLFGRRTYELFEKFWNHPLDASSTAPDPHHPGTNSGARRNIHLVKRDEQTGLFQDSTERDVEEFLRSSRTRPARDRDSEKPAGQKHDPLRQRLGRFAAHATRLDRRVSVRRLSDSPRQWPAAAQQCIEELEIGSFGSQTIRVGRRLTSLCAAELDDAVT